MTTTAVIGWSVAGFLSLVVLGLARWGLRLNKRALQTMRGRRRADELAQGRERLGERL